MNQFEKIGKRNGFLVHEDSTNSMTQMIIVADKSLKSLFYKASVRKLNFTTIFHENWIGKIFNWLGTLKNGTAYGISGILSQVEWIRIFLYIILLWEETNKFLSGPT